MISSEEALKRQSRSKLLKEMKGTEGFKRYEKFLKKLYVRIFDQFKIANSEFELMKLSACKELLDEINHWLKVEIEMGENVDGLLKDNNDNDEY